ncbi:MAG: hypothetical protein ABEJ75_00245 [Candidatus Nanohaloarchaea archaeon]
MNVAIRSVKENPLLDRREVKLDIEHEGEPTPSKEDVKSRFTAENGVSKEEVEVVDVLTGFGSKNSVARLKVQAEFEYDEDLEEAAIEDSGETESTGRATAEYEDIVSGTITEAKDALKEMEEPDYRAALEAEKEGKDRKTLKEWLENKLE